MIKYLIILILSFNTFAQQKDISCGDGACSTNFYPDEQKETQYYSGIIIEQNTDNINAELLEDSNKRDLRLFFEQKDIIGKNLSVDFSSKKDGSSAANIIAISDILNQLTMNLNGYEGKDGKSSSELCAEEYLKGNQGIFGETARDSFEQRRLFDLTIPQNQCTTIDVKYLSDYNFTCEEGYEEVDANNPTVYVKRLKGKNKCIGLSYMDICLSKTVEVTCTWKIKFVKPLTLAGTYSNGSTYPDTHTKILKMSESEYNEKSLIPGQLEYLCNSMSFDPLIDSPPKNVIKNGEFYFDLRDWLNDSVTWSNGQMKLLGGPNQIKRPNAEQILSTIPGKRYRVIGNFFTDESVDHVSSGEIIVWADSLKQSILKKESLFEDGAIKGVFLASDDLPYHFGYVYENTNSLSKNITITNKDDRKAINCSYPYLEGDSDDFEIVSDNCGTNDLDIGASCDISIRANPKSVGQKSVSLKRVCRDDYGNINSQLDEKLYTSSWKNYYQTTVNGQPAGSYIDGFFWKKENDGSSDYWYRCELDFDNNKNCFASSITTSTYRGEEKGQWHPGYEPMNMFLDENTIPVAEINEFPIVKRYNPSLPSSQRANEQWSSKPFDFIFTANDLTTIITLKSVLKYHPGFFDNITIYELTDSSGSDVKPPQNPESCTEGLEGCISSPLFPGSLGYYSLYGTPSATVTSPGYDTTFYTIPEDSDWNIQYVPVNNSCPQYFSKIKTAHLSSNIGFDENDQLCDDVYIPEDPASDVITWKFVGFERQAEFGTEIIQCSVDNCLIESSLRNSNRNLVTFSPESGENGTEQGEGLLFVYSYKYLNLQAQNGKGGIVGDSDLNEVSDLRVCAKIKDVNTEGEDSLFAREPIVNFVKYNWSPIRILEKGNYGDNPVNNGNQIKIIRKIDSSVRYLLKKELI